ncbi:MAG: hypothetical protein ACRD28_12765 [Acidobacteriaceae bacterium]
MTLTTGIGTQFTSSQFLATLGRIGITHRRTAYHHPESNSYIESKIALRTRPSWLSQVC